MSWQGSFYYDINLPTGCAPPPSGHVRTGEEQAITAGKVVTDTLRYIEWHESRSFPDDSQEMKELFKFILFQQHKTIYGSPCPCHNRENNQKCLRYCLASLNLKQFRKKKRRFYMAFQSDSLVKANKQTI